MAKYSMSDSSIIIELLQYELKLAEIKYENELRREDSIIRQSGNMQSAFSFVTAAVFMVATVVLEYKGKLSLEYILIVFSSITLFLLFSLFAATMAQNRRIQEAFPNTQDQNIHIESNIGLLKTEEQRLKYLIESYSKIQLSLTDNNSNRIKWIKISMCSFYISLVLCVIWFIISIIFLSR